MNFEPGLIIVSHSTLQLDAFQFKKIKVKEIKV